MEAISWLAWVKRPLSSLILSIILIRLAWIHGKYFYHLRLSDEPAVMLCHGTLEAYGVRIQNNDTSSSPPQQPLVQELPYEAIF